MRVMNSLSLEKQTCNGGSRVIDSLPPPSVSVLRGPPPPAPPPPPPPPPPPLPPPPPGVGNPVLGHRKKRRVRSFFWKTIPEEKVRAKPNIWTLAARQQQYQIDVRTIEELFGQHEEACSGSGLGHGGRVRNSLKETKKEICILDSKRGMNIGIFLKQFRKSNQVIVEDISLGKSAPFGPEPLKELLKLLPDKDELKKLRAFQGDADCLSLADSFMYLLVQVPSFDLRLEAMVLKEEFVTLSSTMSKEIDIMHTATKELMSCEELHAILHLVLQAGNIMNAGGYAGNAVGFKLSSLPSLADTKANKPEMNLLHFVALEAQKKDVRLLKFPEKLAHVQSAARMSLENVEAELQSLHHRTQSVEARVQRSGELKLQLDELLQNWLKSLQDLKKRWADLRKEGNTLVDFFCEDKDTFKLDDCFRIFQDFCLKFKKAVQDNWERELKEAARQRRLRELEEKRHSWAGNGDQGGGFGRSSSENDVEMLTREGLLDFLQQRPRSPNSPMGRSSSARRHRSATAAAAADADRKLHIFLELAADANGDAGGQYLSLPRHARSPVRGKLGLPRGSSEAPPTLHAGSDLRVDDADSRGRGSFASPVFMIGNNRETNVFLKAAVPASQGQMNVSIEKCSLVPELRPFDFVPPVHDANDNMCPAGRGDVVITDLDILDSPFSGTSSGVSSESIADRDDKTNTGSEQGGSGTVSSMTHKPPPALDPSVSNKQPALHFLDSTDTDCSAILDSETDSLVSTGGSAADIRTLVSHSNLNALHSASSVSSNEPSVSASTDEKSVSLSTKEQSVSASTNGQPVSSSTNEQSASASTNEQSFSASTNEKAESPPSNDHVVSTSTYEHSASPPSCKDLVMSSAKDKPASTPTNNRSASPSANRHSVSAPTNDQPEPQSISDGSESVLMPSKDATANGKQRGEKPMQDKPAANTRAANPKSKPAAKNSGDGTKTRPVRTLTTSENQSMRKVVPISKGNRSGGVAGRAEQAGGQENTCRSPQDHAAPARRTEVLRGTSRRTSLPLEEQRPRKASQAGNQTLCRPSFRKPAAKSGRTTPRPPPEEKMCRSTMRALALCQASAGGSAPPTPVHTPKAALPGFSRNTVASSSRRMKTVSGPSSTPSTPSKTGALTQADSLWRAQNRVAPAGGLLTHGDGETTQGPLKRSTSGRGYGRTVHPNETPPSPGDHPRKYSSSLSDKSVHSKDSASSNTLKPTWK